jgi:hypothetical protein
VSFLCKALWYVYLVAASCDLTSSRPCDALLLMAIK